MPESIERLILLGISLLLFLAMLGVAFFGLYEGKTFFGEQEDQINHVYSASDVEFIMELDKLNGKRIPAVTAYNLVVDHRDICASCVCNVCGKTTAYDEAGSCLESHLMGKVSITYTRTDNGQLNITFS